MAMRRLSNGLWAIEPRRREFFGLVHQILPLGLGALQAQDDIQIDGQADFLLYATSSIFQDGQAKIQLLIQPDRFLFQFPPYISALGLGQFPRWQASPQVIPRAQTYSLKADDRRLVQVGTNNIRVLSIGQKVYDKPFEHARAYQTVLPFDYVANFTANDGGNGPIPANSTQVFPVIMFADSDFDIYKISIYADGDATIQIETSGKALLWFNRPCHIALLGGTTPNAAIPSGAWPFKLPGPVRVPASGTIMTTVADLSGASNRVQVVYHGLRMKPPGGLPMDPRSMVQLLAA